MVEKSTAHLRSIITQIHTLSKDLLAKINDDIRENSVTLGVRPRKLSDLSVASKGILEAQIIIKKIHKLRTDMNVYQVVWAKTQIAALPRENIETRWTIAVSQLNQEIAQRTTLIQKNLLNAYELLDHYSTNSIQDQHEQGATDDDINSSWQTNHSILTELLRQTRQASDEMRDKISTTLMFLPTA